MNETLKELINQSNEIMIQLAENNGELTEEMELALAKIELSLPAKVDSYSNLMDRLETEEAHWKQKAEFYSRIAKSCKALRERLRGNIKFAMEELQVEEIKGNDVKFKLSRSKPTLIINENVLDESYKNQVVVMEVDKKRIEADLKSGLHVFGASLEENFSLRTYANKKD